MTERRPGDATAVRPGDVADRAGPRGFRPASRRRSRIAAGVILAAVAIGGNVLLYASLDDRSEVLQLVRDVRAGDVVESDDLRVIEADLDPSVPVVTADRIGSVVGRYARVYLPSGSLVVEGLVQADPLVSDGAGVVAVDVGPARVPAGLTTRSQVLLVVVDDRSGEPFVTTARVVGRPDDDGSSMSVEVAVSDAPRIAAADDVRVVLIEAGVDDATEAGAGG